MSFNRTWRTWKWGCVKRSYNLFGWPHIAEQSTSISPVLGPFDAPKPEELSIPLGGETFSPEEVLSGTVISPERCSDVPNGIWVEFEGKGDCIRYYAAGLDLAKNPRAMVYFGGDALLLTSKGMRHVASSYQSETPAKIEADMADWSHGGGVPAIFMARPGLHGSSGDHKNRRHAREIALLDQALDALKERYAITSFILTGQSGGGHIVAALLNRRADIEAAVMTSALVSVKRVAAHWEYQRNIPNRLISAPDCFYDPLDDVDQIVTKPPPQIYVISDPEDQSIPFTAQLHYVRRLKAAGLNPQHIFAHAPGPGHHVLSGHGKRAAALFARGATASRIRAELKELDCVSVTNGNASGVARPFQRYSPPGVDARSAISVKTAGAPGEPTSVLFEKAPRQQMPPASLTKLMTAIVALDIARYSEVGSLQFITVEEADKAAGSGLNVSSGDKISLQDAVANLLIPSSNITANAVARTYGQMLLEREGNSDGDPLVRFVAEMEAKSAQLAMLDTRFKNPSGLPARGQVTTAADISLLMATAMRYEHIANVWTKPSHLMDVGGPNPRTVEIVSSVKVVDDYDLRGAKTGTLLPRLYNVAVLSEAPNDNHIITVVLGAANEVSLYGDLRRIVDAVKRGHKWSA